jgi:hypothetical protein
MLNSLAKTLNIIKIGNTNFFELVRITRIEAGLAAGFFVSVQICWILKM